MSTENMLFKAASSPLLLATIIVVVLFLVFIRWKKNSSKSQQSSGSMLGGANMMETSGGLEIRKKLTPEELLNKAWEFLSNIAEKVLKMNSTTQKDIIDIGHKMKESGMVFAIMVEDGSSEVPRSPAKEKAAQEQKKSNSLQQSQ
jgi:hypothetical protein